MAAPGVRWRVDPFSPRIDAALCPLSSIQSSSVFTNGRLYKLSFRTEDKPLAFTLASGSDCPYWEASKKTIDQLIVDMNKAHPSSNYCWRGVLGYQMGVSAEGLVPDSSERKLFVKAELLRCKQVLDLAIDGQHEVIFASKRARERASEADDFAE